MESLEKFLPLIQIIGMIGTALYVVISVKVMVNDNHSKLKELSSDLRVIENKVNHHDSEIDVIKALCGQRHGKKSIS